MRFGLTVEIAVADCEMTVEAAVNTAMAAARKRNGAAAEERRDVMPVKASEPPRAVLAAV